MKTKPFHFRKQYLSYVIPLGSELQFGKTSEPPPPPTIHQITTIDGTAIPFTVTYQDRVLPNANPLLPPNRLQSMTITLETPMDGDVILHYTDSGAE